MYYIEANQSIFKLCRPGSDKTHLIAEMTDISYFYLENVTCFQLHNVNKIKRASTPNKIDRKQT